MINGPMIDEILERSAAGVKSWSSSSVEVFVDIAVDGPSDGSWSEVSTSNGFGAAGCGLCSSAGSCE